MIYCFFCTVTFTVTALMYISHNIQYRQKKRAGKKTRGFSLFCQIFKKNNLNASSIDFTGTGLKFHVQLLKIVDLGSIYPKFSKKNCAYTVKTSF
jgi:hypothetical protein